MVRGVYPWLHPTQSIHCSLYFKSKFFKILKNLPFSTTHTTFLFPSFYTMTMDLKTLAMSYNASPLMWADDVEDMVASTEKQTKHSVYNPPASGGVIPIMMMDPVREAMAMVGQSAPTCEPLTPAGDEETLSATSTAPSIDSTSPVLNDGPSEISFGFDIMNLKLGADTTTKPFVEVSSITPLGRRETAATTPSYNLVPLDMRQGGGAPVVGQISPGVGIHPAQTLPSLPPPTSYGHTATVAVALPLEDLPEALQARLAAASESVSEVASSSSEGKVVVPKEALVQPIQPLVADFEKEEVLEVNASPIYFDSTYDLGYFNSIY